MAARIAVLAATAALVAAAIGFLVVGNPFAGGPGGPFRLVDDGGKPVSERDFAGAPYGMFFGYTHCPDVCPTTLADYQLWRQELGAAADGFRLAFVTVDPARDTPEVLRNYLSSFEGGVVGLTGSEAAVADVVRRFRVYREKVPGEDGEYTINHTATVFLFDRHGRFSGKISYQAPTAEAVAALRAVIAAP